MRPRCFHEGCAGVAPYGTRFPGLVSELPEKYRGYLWSCEEHLGEARARRDAAYERAKGSGEIEAVQLGLFGGEERRKKP